MKIAVFVYIGAALAILTTASGKANAAGEQAFVANKCGECHLTQGPAPEKTIADQLAKKAELATGPKADPPPEIQFPE